MIFIENNIARGGDIMRMQIIHQETFSMRFETKKNAWVSLWVKFASMSLDCINVTQTSKNSKIRNVTWVAIKLFIR